MGLDCTAYSHMQHQTTLPLKPDTRLPEYPADDTFFDRLYNNDGRVVFADGAFGHDPIAGLIPGGIYFPTPKTEVMGWRAGSYSGYGDWRNRLSVAILDVPAQNVWADHDRYRDKPFFELIDFSDCEGILGPVAAQNLLADFQENRELYLDYIRDDMQEEFFLDLYVRLYDEWTNAVTLAAQDGMVVFH